MTRRGNQNGEGSESHHTFEEQVWKVDLVVRDNIIAVFKYLNWLNVNEREFCTIQKQHEYGFFFMNVRDIKM